MASGIDLGCVSIIGIACRFPGAPDHRAFWRNLCDGVESITCFTDAELAAEGIPPQKLTDPSYVKSSPLLPDFDRFDAAFFDYSPREAALMDPQQRVLLEAAWEAFEDAGQIPGRVSDGPVGVFVGSGGVVTSYLLDRLAANSSLPGDTGSLAHIGNDKDFLSARVSYKLGLTGPSINVQTACSTSLVAVHLACQSILAGESDMALAGGATVRVPQKIGYQSVKGGIQSPDGHCRAFDADAQGTVFGSGVGMVLLKDLATAIADRNTIYAIIRGTAINNDGAVKVSLTASSVAGQARAMVEAMNVAGIAPEKIGYIECHGTGTVVGDPLEIEALTRAFRTSTPENGFCAIGSVKTNIGHLEQTAGIAALIKTALALRHGRIPPSLHFRTPNPKIPFANSPFFVNTVCRDWPDRGPTRHAAVNSLGLGGTNVFAVLEQPPAHPQLPLGRQVQILTLSGRSKTALTELKARHHAALQHLSQETDLADACFTLNTGRVHHAHRFAASVANLAEAQAALSSDRLPEPAPLARRLAFLFSGQGSQYAGMGAELYRSEPVFRDVIDRCAAQLRGRLDPPLQDVIFGLGETGRLINETAWTQPALFVLQAALSELWRSWGIVPDAVLGHSVGEFAALCCAGAMELEEALALIAERGRLMQSLPPTGAMAAVFTDADGVAAAMALHGDETLAIAGVNAPQSTVISGLRESVIALMERLTTDGIRCQLLNVSHAFHSPLMQPIAGMLAQAAGATTARIPHIIFVSTVTGATVKQAPDADYWVEHALRSVQFRDGMRSLAAGGMSDFVEIGPGNTLLALGRQCVEDTGSAWLCSLQRGRGEMATLAASIARLYERGYEIDWPSWHRGQDRRRVSLPTYPFERRRFWLEPDGTRADEAAEGSGPAGARLRSALPETQFERSLSQERQHWLHDHRIYGMQILPTTVGLVMLEDAARQHFDAGCVLIANTQYREAMSLPESGERIVQTILTPMDEAAAEIRFASASDGKTWHTHMVGLARRDTTAKREPLSLPAIRARCGEEIKPADYYAALNRSGLQYGPAFRGIDALWRGDGETLTHVLLPDNLPAGDALHPALLDACLHIYPALADDFATDAQKHPRPTLLPIGVERFHSAGKSARAVFTHAVRRPSPAVDHSFILDLHIYHEDGPWLASIEGLVVRPLSAEALAPRDPAATLDWLYTTRWDPCPALANPPPPDPAKLTAWFILADRGGVGVALAGHLAARGEPFRLLHLNDPGDPAAELALALQAALHEFAASTAAKNFGIIHLWSLDVTLTGPGRSDPGAAQQTILGSALALLQAAVAARDVTSRLFLVSRNAFTALAGEPPGEPARAGLWGFGRTVALEHPLSWGGLIDLDHTVSPSADATLLLREICGGDAEDQIALRNGARFGLRLVRPPTPSAERAPFSADATYLITGGLGALGMELARWLVTKRGVRHLALVSRRGESDPAATPSCKALAALGAEATVLQADVTNAAEIASMIALLGRTLHPLKGVFHCAGLLDDGVLTQMDWPKMQRVLAPKVVGGWNLHVATRDISLDHFVLFSSVLGLMGSAGQANYAAANTVLDALAAHRRQLGLKAITLNFGPWAEAGIATVSGEKGQAIWRARGTSFISSETGLQAFDALIGSDLGQAAITLTQWPVFLQQFAAIPPFYATLAKQTGIGRQLAAQETDAVTFRSKLRAAAEKERRELLVEFIRRHAMHTMAISEPIDTARPLREYGLDSLMSVTLLNRLEAVLSVRIPPDALIAGPSVAALADHILLTLPRDDHAPPPPHATAPAISTSSGRWLVMVGPRPAPRARLFCFPFAGGGSAVFRKWAEALDSSIEIVAIEPPGRLARIGEPPVTDIAAFIEGLMSELPSMLDIPFAFFGHCLGGLTSYEVTRHLLQAAKPLPRHLFVSGARPPDRLNDYGSFEERLTQALLRLTDFRVALPPHMQPDNVFTEIIRHFEIATSEQMLSEAALRDLMLPVIRAEFAMASSYVFKPEAPLEIPIACFAAKGDPYVSRSHALGWGRFTNCQLQLFIREGKHFAVQEDSAFIQRVINREMCALARQARHQ